MSSLTRLDLPGGCFRFNHKVLDVFRWFHGSLADENNCDYHSVWPWSRGGSEKPSESHFQRKQACLWQQPQLRQERFCRLESDRVWLILDAACQIDLDEPPVFFTWSLGFPCWFVCTSKPWDRLESVVVRIRARVRNWASGCDMTRMLCCHEEDCYFGSCPPKLSVLQIAKSDYAQRFQVNMLLLHTPAGYQDIFVVLKVTGELN